MPVTSTHSDYNYYAPIWKKMRDVVAGEEAVHGEGTRYLPKLGAHDEEDYRAYVMRASFFNATQRTVDGLSGMVFRRPPKREVPEGLEKFLEDVDLEGNQLQGFVENIVDEILVTGRAGILVDHTRRDESVRNRADAERVGARPFFKYYNTESIIDWRDGTVGNKTGLVHVRLLETMKEVEPGDEFVTREVTQVRVLDFDENGNYRQRLYDAETEKQTAEFIPKMNGKAMKFIPFIFLGTKDLSASVPKPPLLDLANVNLSHYRTTADLEHGAHWTGCPTAVITGHPDQNTTFTIGSQEAWVIPEAEARAIYLEFTGQGLQALENLQKTKEAQMATIGARMLAPEKKAAETAEAEAIRRGGENSALASLAQAVSDGIEAALKILAEWAGVAGDISYELNRDYVPKPLGPQEAEVLMAMLQAGYISYEDYIDRLKDADWIAPNRTPEQIRADVQTLPPPGVFGLDATS